MFREKDSIAGSIPRPGQCFASGHMSLRNQTEFTKKKRRIQMAKFILSAFADEASPVFDEQLTVLREENISLIELRNADGGNASKMTLAEAEKMKKKLDAAGIRLSALGSPFGKAPLDVPFDEHFQAFRHGLEICKVLDCQRIRMFSFFPPKGEAPALWRDEVLRRLEMMISEAEKAGILLVHENEKEIYGDITERCVDLLDFFGPRMGFAFDPANFIQCHVRPLDAYDALHTRITYMHIKDAIMETGAVVAAGHGDGEVPTLLKRLNQEREDDVILTIEPHLTVFAGLKELQSEELTHAETYPDNRTAFHCACEALREILKTL